MFRPWLVSYLWRYIQILRQYTWRINISIKITGIRFRKKETKPILNLMVTNWSLACVSIQISGISRFFCNILQIGYRIISPWSFYNFLSFINWLCANYFIPYNPQHVYMDNRLIWIIITKIKISSWINFHVRFLFILFNITW